MIRDQPTEFVKLIAKILPQETKAEINAAVSFLDVLKEANLLARSKSVAVEDLQHRDPRKAIRSECH